MSLTGDTCFEPPTYHALDRRTVAEIQRKVIKRSGRNVVSRLLHAKNDERAIAAWKSDLNRVLHVFNVCSLYSCSAAADHPSQTELTMNTHTIVVDMRRDMLKSRGDTDGQNLAVNGTRALRVTE